MVTLSVVIGQEHKDLLHHALDPPPLQKRGIVFFLLLGNSAIDASPDKEG